MSQQPLRPNRHRSRVPVLISQELKEKKECQNAQTDPPGRRPSFPPRAALPGRTAVSRAVSGSAEPLEAAAAGQSWLGFVVPSLALQRSFVQLQQLWGMDFITNPGIPAETLTFTTISPLLPESSTKRQKPERTHEPWKLLYHEILPLAVCRPDNDSRHFWRTRWAEARTITREVLFITNRVFYITFISFQTDFFSLKWLKLGKFPYIWSNSKFHPSIPSQLFFFFNLVIY